MSMFERAAYSPAQVTAEELKQAVPSRVAPQPEYAQYTDVATGVDEYPADVTLAGLDQALGSRITRLLLTTDAESTLHVSAQVLADHAKKAKGRPRDLQANLMANVVKEMAQADEDLPVNQRPKFCEDILRRCSLEADFKQKLKQELFDKQAVHTPYLCTLPMEA